MNSPLQLVIAPVLSLACGLVGLFLFGLILSYGIYAMVLPGLFFGFGGGILIYRNAKVNGLICGGIALIMSYLAEWHYRPFVADDSFAYFVENLGGLSWFTHLMIIISVWLTFSMATGLRRPSLSDAIASDSLKDSSEPKT